MNFQSAVLNLNPSSAQKNDVNCSYLLFPLPTREAHSLLPWFQIQGILVLAQMELHFGQQQATNFLEQLRFHRAHHSVPVQSPAGRITANG
jgi:hypothetical protein